MPLASLFFYLTCERFSVPFTSSSSLQEKGLTRAREEELAQLMAELSSCRGISVDLNFKLSEVASTCSEMKVGILFLSYIERRKAMGLLDFSYICVC